MTSSNRDHPQGREDHCVGLVLRAEMHQMRMRRRSAEEEAFRGSSMGTGTVEHDPPLRPQVLPGTE